MRPPGGVHGPRDRAHLPAGRVPLRCRVALLPQRGRVRRRLGALPPAGLPRHPPAAAGAGTALPPLALRLHGGAASAASSKKETFLGLTKVAVLVDGGSMAVWLAKGSGAKCVALSARRLSLPWEDGEFSWRWTPHPLSRFADVAQLVDCTCLDIYGRLPTAVLTPATAYAAYLVFTTTDDHRGLSFPDQETTVSVGGSAPSLHTMCLRPDTAEAHKFRGGKGTDGVDVRGPALRGDGWWEMEMGRLRTGNKAVVGEEVAVSFEMLGWYPKRGLVVEGVEFRPL